MAMVLMQTNVVYWLLFLLQWNLMSRSVDVSKINITSISFNGDMLTINYTHRKTEQKKFETEKSAHCINKNIDNVRLFEGSSVQAGYSKAIEKALKNSLATIKTQHNGK